MTPDDARRVLAAALDEHAAAVLAEEDARDAVYAAVRQVAPTLKQTEIIDRTGYGRAHVLRIVNGQQRSAREAREAREARARSTGAAAPIPSAGDRAADHADQPAAPTG